MVSSSLSLLAGIWLQDRCADCGHGSRNRLAVDGVARLATGCASACPRYRWNTGYLEFARPILRDGLESLRSKAWTRCWRCPGCWFAAGHAKNDIPPFYTYTAETGLRIDYGPRTGHRSQNDPAAAARIRDALVPAAQTLPSLHDTLLVVVGLGLFGPRNAQLERQQVTRMLVEGMGFGLGGKRCIRGQLSRLVEPGLRHAVKLGFKRWCVSLFLFSGVLVSRNPPPHRSGLAADHPDITLPCGLLASAITPW